MDCPQTVVSSGALVCPGCGSANVSRLDCSKDHQDFQTLVTSYRCQCGVGFTKMTWKEARVRQYGLAS